MGLGIGIGNAILFNNKREPIVYEVGDPLAGGVVASTTTVNGQYLVISKYWYNKDSSGGTIDDAAWDTYQPFPAPDTGASLTALGTGPTNTDTIISALSGGPWLTTSAAYIVRQWLPDYSLPSKDEHVEIQQNYVDINAGLVNIGGDELENSFGFAITFWTSTEATLNGNPGYALGGKAGLPIEFFSYIKNTSLEVRGIKWVTP
tara:strand:- start:5978 stop:6589 length:612 start_codon:yes stop_codon:yes gene_type:complete